VVLLSGAHIRAAQIELIDIDAIRDLVRSPGVTYAHVRNVIRRTGGDDDEVRSHLQ
jgi:hypothetical protein